MMIASVRLVRYCVPDEKHARYSYLTSLVGASSLTAVPRRKHSRLWLQGASLLGRHDLLPAQAHFGNINCTWNRICQLAPSSGRTTL